MSEKKDNEPFLSALRTLTGAEPPRVWSLIVTVFGDLAQQQDAVISGPVLSDILSPVGVRPEAMRVALYRLRNEGWIETKKRGREALHQLSATGLSQSSAASGRIYQTSHAADHEWHVLCYPPALSGDEHARTIRLERNGYIAISAGVYLANGPAQTQDAEALTLQGLLGDIPEWLSQNLVPRTLVSAFKDLSAALQLLDLTPENINELSPIEIATLRALIVHRWRKLVLKLPDVPDALFGPDFAGTACRAQVMQVLAQLPMPELSTLARGALKL